MSAQFITVSTLLLLCVAFASLVLAKVTYCSDGRVCETTNENREVCTVYLSPPYPFDCKPPCDIVDCRNAVVRSSQCEVITCRDKGKIKYLYFQNILKLHLPENFTLKPTSSLEFSTNPSYEPTSSLEFSTNPSYESKDNMTGGCFKDTCFCPKIKKKCDSSFIFEEECVRFSGPDCNFPCDVT